mmetsp:Transcript_17954/g.48788  ORF Transcript_17954/g.48788 Transcript_17954/m.48788 type:complete len:912 (+) Transcript_17954:166-2901(+)
MKSSDETGESDVGQPSSSSAIHLSAQSSATTSAMPTSPTSPPSFSRRRRMKATQQGRDGSTLFVLQERRPPSVSTATAMSESVSYSSSEGEDSIPGPRHNSQQLYSGEDDGGMEEVNEEPYQIRQSHGLEWMHEDDPRSTVMDLEMGILRRSSGDSSVRTSHSSSRSNKNYGRQPFYSPALSSSPPSVASSISSSTSFRSRRNRNNFEPLQRQITPNNSSNNNNASQQSSKSTAASLRKQLDAGMAAMRSWIRARGTSSLSNSSLNSESVESRQRSRSVSWQPTPHASSTAASVASTTQEELDDLLQPDDLSVNSTRTEDSHRSVGSGSRYRPASAPTVPMPYTSRHRQSHSHLHHHLTFSFQPDTIMEESGGVDEADTESSARGLFSRKRSQSEPDGRKIPDFFMGSASSTRHRTFSSSGTPRQRRRYRNDSRRHRPHYVHQHHTTQTQQHASPFTRRLPRSSLAGGDSEVAGSQQLSSSAAAALCENPNANASISSFVPSEFSDAGASVGTGTTGTIAPDSALVAPSPIVPSGANSSIRSNVSVDGRSISTMEAAGEISSPMNASSASLVASPTQASRVGDSERQARIRWIQINRRFQFVITVVALIFSLLLFAILICWVIFTSSYVLAFDKDCDLPLKTYFWLVTLQLVLDVFRNDIMRHILRWEANSNQRAPARIVAYNGGYLVYAAIVLHIGIRSVFIDSGTCPQTSPELYNAALAFVSLSISAWATIVCGYLLPFCVVAAMLTCNGYNPTTQTRAGGDNTFVGPGGAQPVFPAAYATTGAPPGTVDKLVTVRLESRSDVSTAECCICMEDFKPGDLLVETSCHHVFHKHCCREWLRQARTCPFCRTDIPGTLQVAANDDHDPSSRIPMGPTPAGLFRILRRTASNISLRDLRSGPNSSSDTEAGN